MNTIVNKLRFALLLGFMSIGIAAWSQGVPYINKMSITTQMFLEEMAGRLTFDQEAPIPSRATIPGVRPLPKPRRPIASPDTIEGKVYIASTVRITNESDLTELENKGVIIQCLFDKGLVTTLIPVDKIEEVAAIDGVKRVNVSALLRPLTNLSRQTTNVDDVLTLSADAQSAGLTSIYDGSGVILGVIDDGIDYQHKAFTDKNGNTRVKGAYCYNGSSVTADWTGTGTLPTTDDSSEDHGTHTSTTAGGSSVIVSGTNVTVTDNHASATYGGMAPGADMFLAGTQLATSYVLNAFQKMNNYAVQQNKPLVVSNSWGSSWFARDGYSDMSDVLAQYFGDNHPNHICLFASGNEAGMGADGQGGGRYVTGTSTQASPLGTIVRSAAWLESYGYQYYSGMLANAWTRATDAQGIGINIHVINKSNGSLNRSYSYTSTNSASQTSVTLAGLNMSVFILFDYVEGQGRHQAVVYTNSYAATSTYVFAIEAYPIGGSSSIVDIYGGDYTYLTNYVNTSGHTWVNGSDDLSMGDEAMDPNVISVGSYVTRNGTNSTGDISDFSSYAAAGVGPTGVQHPWITAPGEVIISGYNHYVSSSNHSATVVNNSTAPYGEMSGTSMAVPHAAGIVALWLQAAQEVGKDLTTTEVKNIMAQTAIKDSWVTSGANRSHFGNGKINALAGIEYILDTYGSSDPVINASPTTVDFSGEPFQSYTETVTVVGRNLTDDITATLNDPNGVYSINTTNLGNGGNLVITFSPTVEGSFPATITLTSPGAEPVTITITGTATIVAEATVADGTTTNTYLPIYGNQYGNKQINQMIYPESMLSEINGKRVKSMTFYAQQLNFSGGAFTVKMGTTTQTTYPQRNHSRITANMTTVKTSQVAVSGGTELVVTFDQPFEYNGGNLVLDFEVTSTGTGGGTTRFYGINPGGYTSFYSYGGTINSYGRYSTGGSRLQFLPKVKFEWETEPITAGTVSPDALTFTDVRIGRTESETVTITNTGNQPFTPVIDTTNLPDEFTVTGSGEVLPNGTLDLTVTYTPTDEGPHSGSFTITIGDVTYTVTVTGNGIIVDSTLTSNTVDVPAYHSDLQPNEIYIFTQEQVDNDIDMGLQYDQTGNVSILVKSDEPIKRYDLMHRDGDEGNWVTVASATHEGNTYVSDGNTMAFGTDTTEMWFPMNDNVSVSLPVTYYVPVTVANGVITQGNTYGAPIKSKEADNVSLQVIIGGSKSDQRLGGHWKQNGVEYCVYTPVITILSNDLDGTRHVPYMYRAWLLSDCAVDFTRGENNAIIGTNPLESPHLLGEIVMGNNETGEHVQIGQDWDIVQDFENKLPNAFGAPSVGANIEIVVRAYYRKAATSGLRDGGYGFAPGGGDGPFDLPTGLFDIATDAHVLSTTYVNSLGMQSDKPFDGLNIVVTRYSDGTVTTIKVIR